MKKHFICLIVSFIMLVSMIPSAYAGDIPDIGGSNEKAIDFVVALGFMDVFEDGTFGGENGVTRAEFAAMAYRLFNLDAQMTDNHFKDVYDDTVQINEINVLVEMGILNGVGNNRFSPDKEVSFTECIKIIMDILGYKEYCTVRGGYPSGYIKAAQQIGLTKSSASGNTKRHIAQILYNAALCEVPEMKSISGEGQINIATQGVTLLEKYHDIYREKGLVTANHLFSIDNEGKTGPGQIRMNGMLMELSEDKFRLYDSVGYYTDVFYRMEKNSDIRTIVYGTKDTGRSKEKVFETEDINRYSAYTIYCEDGEKYSFDSSAFVLKNNELIQSYNEADFKNSYGKVICTKYADCTVVRIIDWEIYVVNFIASDEKKIYNKYNPEKNFTLEEKNANKEYSLHDAYGNTEEFENIEKGDVLCVAEGNGFTDITRISQKQTIRITGMDDEKFYYDGGYFEIGANLREAIENNKENSPKIGQSMLVVFDLYGRAAGFFNESNDGEQLVFLISAAPKKRISAAYEFLFITSAGEFITVEANEKLTYTVGNDEEKVSGKELYEALLDGEDIRRQVAYIKLNSENKITYFEGASEEENWADGKLSCKEVSGNYKSAPMSIGGQASGNGETVVFAYPTSADKYKDTDEYYATPLSSLSNSDTFSATVYMRDKEKIPAVAFSAPQSSVNRISTALFVVDKIKTVMDKEDGEIIQVSGFENGSASVINILDANVLKNPSITDSEITDFTLSCGDVIRYTKGSDNYVTNITVKYDYETSGEVLWDSGKYNAYTNLFHLAAGRASLVDESYIKIDMGEENGYEIHRANSAKITVVDPDNKEKSVWAGSMDDVLDMRSGNPSFVIVRTSSSTCNELIIYR